MTNFEGSVELMKLGSMFDGIGGFPFAASRFGITPVWASEVEPFPILVTRARFPAMKHLGDVCKINGAAVKPVDILTWGSPCQDVSIAGNREGLSGARSGLFNEAVRVCREMLAATDGEYPRYIIFENVPGLLSSGDDFEYVMAKLQGMGDGFLIDPNILDAQFMGVPQRRRRVFIVGINIKVIERWTGYDLQEGQTNTDSHGQISLFEDDDDEPDNLQRLRAGLFTLERYFGNKRQSEVLPFSEGLHGDYPASGQAGEGTARDAQVRAGEPDCKDGESGVAVWPEVAGTLITRCDGSPCVDRGQPFVACFNGHKSITESIQYREKLAPTMDAKMPPNVLCAGLMAGQDQAVALFENHRKDSRYTGPLDVSPSACAQWGTGGNNTPIAVSLDCRNHSANHELSGTLQAKPGGGQSLNYINPICVANGQGNAEICENLSPTLNCDHEQPYIAAGDYIVRRLTPTEVLRLMGLPDAWCSQIHVTNPTEAEIDWWCEVWETHRAVVSHNKKPKNRKQVARWLKNPYSDSVIYKATGNSVAVPCVEFIMRAIMEIEKIH